VDGNCSTTPRCVDSYDCTFDECDDITGDCHFMVTDACTEASMPSVEPTPSSIPAIVVPGVITPTPDVPPIDVPVSIVDVVVTGDGGNRGDDVNGESTNEVAENEGVSIFVSLIGASVVACAACCMMIVGAYTAKKEQKQRDKLDAVMDALENEDELSNMQSNDAFGPI